MLLLPQPITAPLLLTSWILARQALAAGIESQSLSPFDRCPEKCINTGTDPSNWMDYHDTRIFALCNQTMVLEFAVYNPLDDPDTHTTIRACTTDPNVNGFQGQVAGPKTSCATAAKNPATVPATLEMAWLDSGSPGNSAQVVAAAQQIKNYHEAVNTEASCNPAILFGYSGQAAVGFYAGSEVKNQPFTSLMLQQFIDHVQSEGLSNSLLAQLCQADSRGADYAFGIIANTNGSLPSIQKAVRTWSDGNCVTAYDGAFMWKGDTILAPMVISNSNSTTSVNGSTNSTSVVSRHVHSQNKLLRHHYRHSH